MKCPVCSEVNLVMSERQGIEIDYCPQCRGIWLDRGELDKIIERSERAEPQQSAPPPPPREPQRHSPEYDQRGYYDKHSHHRKRKSFLSELFD